MPCRALLLSHSTSRLARRPNAAGTLPRRRLSSRRSVMSRDSWPSAAGMRPARPVPARFRATTRRGTPANVNPSQASIGNVPLQFRLVPPARVSRAAKSVRQSAKRPLFGPARLQAAAPSPLPSVPGCVTPTAAVERACEDQANGRPRLRALPATRNVRRPLRWLTSGGMGPARALPSSTKDRSAVSRPRAAGMCPVRPILARSNATTRLGAAPRMTPCHCPIGVDARQLSCPSPASSSRAAKSVRQSSSRAELPRGDGKQKRSWSMSWSATSHRPAGTSPTKSLPARRRKASCGRAASSSRIGPVKRFPARLSAESCFKFPNWGGMSPRSALPARLNDSSRVN